MSPDLTQIAEAVVKGLFPAGTRLLPFGADIPAAAEYIVVSGSDEPRWILPAHSRSIASILSRWRPYKLTSRLSWSALRCVVAGGLTGAIPGVRRIGIVQPETTDWSHIGWTGQEQPTTAIYIGTPGPHRKCVATLVDPHGEPICVSKSPIGTEAGAKIIHEAEYLDSLFQEPTPLGPQLLHVDRVRGLSSQTYIAGQQSGRDLANAHFRFAKRLISGNASTSFSVCVDKLRAKYGFDAIREHQITGFDSLLVALDEPSEIPASRFHGDFAPWNLILQDGEIIAVDWEDAEDAEPPLLDLVHFEWMTAYVFGRQSTPQRLLSSRTLQWCLENGPLDRAQLSLLEKYFALRLFLTHLNTPSSDPYRQAQINLLKRICDD